MLIQVQFPVWDTRRVSRHADLVLPSPGWPAPEPRRSFIHAVGMVRPRPLGGLSGWVGEDAFCDLSTWVRFPKQQTADVGPARQISVRHLFSRFYFDGTLSGKADFGFFISNDLITSIVRAKARKNTARSPLDAHLGTITEIAAGVSEVPGRLVRSGDMVTLGSLARSFADALCSGTVRREGRGDAMAGALRERLTIGPPTICTESAGPLSRYLVRATYLRDATAGASVALARSRGETSPHVWHIFSRDFDPVRGDRRLLRIALLRLSSDLFCLRRLIADLGRDRLVVQPGSQGAAILQEYIRNLCKRLRSDIDSVQETETGRLARPIFRALFEPGAVEAAFSRLQLIDAAPEIREILRQTIDAILARNGGDSYTLAPGAILVQGSVQKDVTTYVTVKDAGSAGGREAEMSNITTGLGGVTNTGSVGGNITTNVDQSTTLTLTGNQIGELSGHLATILSAARNSPAAEFAPEKIAELEKAKAALDGGNTSGALSILKSAGSWLLDFAGKVGQTVAATAIKAMLGF